MRRTWAVAGAVVLFGAWAARQAAAPPAGEWVEVERDDLPLEVEVTGTLKATRSVYLGPPQVPGVWEVKIASLAPEGKQVAAGEPVLGFDTSELERQLLDRRSEEQKAVKELDKRLADLARQRGDLELRLAEAEVRLRRFTAQAKVPEELLAGAEVAKTQLDLALAEREVAYLRERLAFEERRAQAELASLAERRDRARARVEELEASISQMTVTAPQAGTVVYLSRRGDEKAKVGDTVWHGQTVLEIPDLASLAAVGEVAEADAGRVVPGQAVRLSLDALPGVRLEGTVTGVGNAVRRRDRTSPLKVVEVDVELLGADSRRMRPGMRFRGSIETERLEDVVVLPLTAVEMGAEGPRVTVRRGWRETVVEPRLGRQGAGRVEVKAGLSPGDRVRVVTAAGDGA